MGLLQCPKCKHEMSATARCCPVCGTKMSLFNEIKFQIEHSRIQMIMVVLVALLALGVAWFWRMDSGNAWPLYVVIVLVAPLVPWVLKTAYTIAAPAEDKHEPK
ncbi:MAG: zinc ribbon domain-containing protein [Desulfovibrionaceae bacterium]